MRPTITTPEDEFLDAYLQTLNQLSEMRSRVDRARNSQERRKSLFYLRNARKRCNALRSLVFPREICGAGW